jgi:hypothetical protein
MEWLQSAGSPRSGVVNAALWLVNCSCVPCIVFASRCGVHATNLNPSFVRSQASTIHPPLLPLPSQSTMVHAVPSHSVSHRAAGCIAHLARIA